MTISNTTSDQRQTIPILILPAHQLILPNQTIKSLNIQPSHHPTLLPILVAIEKCLNFQASIDPVPEFIVGAVPIRSITTTTTIDQSITTETTLDSSNKDHDHQLYNWGCTVRVLKITSIPSENHHYLIDLIGLTRFRIDHQHLRAFPLAIAEVTYFEDQDFDHPTDHIQLIKQFKRATISFIETISQQFQPQSNLTNTMVRRRKDQMKRLLDRIETRQLPPLIDTMIQSLDRCDWDERLKFLTFYQAEIKTREMIGFLNRHVQRFQTLSSHPSPNTTPPKISSSSELIRWIESSKSLSQDVKENLIKQRLSELTNEIEDLNAYYRPTRAVGHGRTDLPVVRSNLPRLIIYRRGESGKGDTSGLPFQVIGGKNEESSSSDESRALEQRIKSVGMSNEAEELCMKELKRLKSIPTNSVEHGILSHYLEVMLELPWSRRSEKAEEVFSGNGFLARAQDRLDRDHFGMMNVKKRLIEFLAVIKHRHEIENGGGHVNVSDDDEKKMKTSDRYSTDESKPSEALTDLLSVNVVKVDKSLNRQKAPILLLVGPPGVGKTSIVKSLAKTLGKSFYRISLGGVKDESEIRGHRRTYVGSMPGVIVQALRRVKVNDPVILLDEIDKVGTHNYHGDPSAALLEVLDPEQNSSFVDHYINTPIDLSTILFIATANSTSTISGPLLDRMEIIEVNGYTIEEKVKIGRRNLIPKTMESYRLKSTEFDLDDGTDGQEKVLKLIIGSYTHESGVRSLEREIGRLARAKVVELTEFRESGGGDEKRKKFDPKIRVEDVVKILGPQKC